MVVLSIDPSKAFDSQFPALMLRKLKAYNFSDKSLPLLRSYFQDRRGRVKLAMCTIVRYDIRKGFPRGLCFSPLLWNIFQNDLYYCIKGRGLFMYADDHQLCAYNQLLNNVVTTSKNEAEIVTGWFSSNFLLNK